MVLLTKSPGSPKSFQEVPRKLQKNQGRNPYNMYFRCYFGQNDDAKDISKLTDLYWLAPSVSNSHLAYVVKSDAARPTYLKIWRHMWMLPKPINYEQLFFYQIET